MMKKVTLLLALIFAVNLTAQTQYEKGMNKAFELWGTQKNGEAAQLFERISNAEKDNWLPSYYAATVLIIDGFAIKSNKRVTICAICAKTNCTDKNHRRHLCTSAGYWVEVKKKYNWKIMGRYRLALWIRKEDARIAKESKDTKESFSD